MRKIFFSALMVVVSSIATAHSAVTLTPDQINDIQRYLQCDHLQEQLNSIQLCPSGVACQYSLIYESGEGEIPKTPEVIIDVDGGIGVEQFLVTGSSSKTCSISQ